MKRFCIFVFIILICSFLYADIILKTPDGRNVILRDNGTWIYEDEQNKESLQILTHGITNNDRRDVFGRVKNNSEINYSYIVITIDYLDKDGKMIDTDSVRIYNLKAGTFQSFKTIHHIISESYEIYISSYVE